MSFSDIKKRARNNLKEHYLLFAVLLLLASFVGVSYSSSLSAIRSSSDNRSFLEQALDTSIDSFGEYSAVVKDIFDGNFEKAKKYADETEIEIRKSDSRIGIVELGHQNGVFASISNSLSSGSIFVKTYQFINSLIRSKSVSQFVFTLLMVGAFYAFYFGILMVYEVVYKRIFLESWKYEYVPASRYSFLLQVRRWSSTARTLFIVSLRLTLWWLTIVMGPIKMIEYSQVGYVLAENPFISAKDAIAISRQMMKGHRFEYFKLELSFIGWHLLSILTLGLSAILFSNVYKECTMLEYYVYLREEYKNSGLELADKLNDKYLYEKANSDDVNMAYKDIHRIMNDDITIKHHRGLRGFFEDNLGLSFVDDEDERQFNEAIEQEQKIIDTKRILDLNQYPTRLNLYEDDKVNPRVEKVHYLRHYNIWSVVAMFFVFCMIGWLWEVGYGFVCRGFLSNRGVLHGPWLPIYGSGGIMILLILYRFRNRPLLEFVSAILLCGIVEYFTAYYLEMSSGGIKWWDYSGFFLNIHGRVCAEGLLVFGLGGIAVVYFLAPLLDNCIKKINRKKLIPVCLVLLIIFFADAIYSRKHPNTGAGVTTYVEVSNRC